MNYNKIVALVYEARKIIHQKEKIKNVKNKNPYDFVTEVDIGISNFLKHEFAKVFPDVGFMTEEESVHTLSNKCFIVDPIDGTTNLIYDYRMSSISVAYIEDGIVEFGVVFNPFNHEMFFAIRNHGAFRFETKRGIKPLLDIGVENYRKQRLSVSSRPLNLSIIEFGTNSSRKHISAETFGRAKNVFEQCLDLRRICSTAIAICYIAAGRIDGYFEKHIKPWDYAAACLILEEAGGLSSNWAGEKLPLDTPGSIVCSNASIFEELKTLINAEV